MVNDPLDTVFMSPEECLAMYLRAMPKNLIPVFQREFMRRPTTGAVDETFCACKDDAFINDETPGKCGNCGKPFRH